MQQSTFEVWVARLLGWLDEAGRAGVAPPVGDPPPGDSATAPVDPAGNPTGQPKPDWQPSPGFNTLALELFALQFQRVEPYRRYCEHLGRTPDRVSNWLAIPCIPTAGFKEFELTSLSPDNRPQVFYSSGTTGQQVSRHYHSTASLEVYEHSLLPWFARHLLPDRSSMRILSLVPPAADAQNSSLAHMLTAVLRRYGTAPSRSTCHVSPEGVWELDVDLVQRELESACAANEPLLLTGTAFGFVHLLESMDDRGLRIVLPAGSRLMETGGYKGRSRALAKAELYSRLTRALGIPELNIVSEYGMSELSSQAYDRQAGILSPRRLRFPPWCAARVASPETGTAVGPGESGLLEVVDLANAFSVLAVQTEDLAIAREDGFEYAGRASAATVRGCSLMHR
jgi:hypothetical protein